VGRPDVFAVDADGALVVIELKADEAGSDALLQGLRYFEWFVDRLELIARAYPLVDPAQPIRLFVAAPSFDDGIRRLAKYLDVSVSFVHLAALRNDTNGDVGVTVRLEEVERRSAPDVHLQSEDEILGYVSDSEVRGEVMKVVADLKSLGAAVRPYKGGKYRWLEFLVGQEPVAYLKTLRRSFHAEHDDHDADPWPRVKDLRAHADWATRSRPFVESKIKALKRGA
jgi:hypothetical protein